MHDARAVLAELLRQLELPDAHASLRVQASSLANRLAMFHSEPSLADVAESIAVDVADDADPTLRASLVKEAAIARATRRAIALAHRHRLSGPRELALSLVADPHSLCTEVRKHIAEGEKGMAQATLEIGLTRHPESPDLRALHAEFLGSPSPEQP
jgi:hypothetical protein